MTLKKRIKIPIGIDDFEKLRSNGYCYVDKSLFIEEIVDGDPEVALITRPRRFGKTLNMSMLRCFLDCTRPSSKKLFSGLAIAKKRSFCKKHMNKYPVIFITFKESGGKSSWEECYKQICSSISYLFKQHIYLLESDKIIAIDKKNFNEIISGSKESEKICNSLKFLSQLLHQHHGIPTYILIDEYDAAIHSAFANGYYDMCIETMRSIYSACLKGNEHLAKGILTGILRVSRESIFSGFNNPSIYTVLQDQCSKQFGILESELVTLLNDFELQDKLQNLREWYNGYRFGNTTLIYNPWSILKWLEDPDHVLRPHWVNTSQNALIKQIFLDQHKMIKPELLTLFFGGNIVTTINENTTFQDDLTRDPSIFWGFILQTGYVTFTNSIYEGDKVYYTLKIPNKEVHIVFQDMVNSWVASITKELKNPELTQTLGTALIHNDLQLFHQSLQEILLQTMSYHDFANNPENAFHAFMAGLLVWLSGIYEVKSNKESGLGRYDLVLIPKKNNYPGYIFEFKSLNWYRPEAPPKELITKELQGAYEQIDKKMYATEFATRHVATINKVGLLFHKKQVWMKEPVD